jgi:hypothetical protein
LTRWTNLARQQPSVFGPIGGSLVSPVVGQFGWSPAGVRVADFAAHAQLTAPQVPTGQLWDFGFGFRSTEGGQEFRLIVRSDGAWFLFPSQDAAEPAAQGTLTGLDTAPGATLPVDLVAVGDVGYFRVGSAAAAFDLSARNQPGDVWLGAGGVLNADDIPGIATAFSDYQIWSLDGRAGTPAASGGPPTIPAIVATVTPAVGESGSTVPTRPPIVIANPTPAVGIVGTSYLDPETGWSVRWDPSWAAALDSSGLDLTQNGGSAQGGVSLFLGELTEGNGDGWFTAERLADPASCAEWRQTQGSPPAQAATDASGQPVRGQDARGAWAVFTYTDVDANGTPISYAQYVECRVLVPNAALLWLSATAPLAQFNATIGSAEAVFDTATLPPPGSWVPVSVTPAPAAAPPVGTPTS